MKLNNKSTVLIGLAFMSILAFWQFYDQVIPYILENVFGLSTLRANSIMAIDNVLAIFMLPLFGALSDRTRTPLGKRTPYTLEVEKKAEALGVRDRLIILDKVPFEDLAPIYHLAEVFIYPSRYEGFGIPIIEAVNCGVPVIAATGSCLEEAGGPDCMYVNPDDEKALAAAIDTFTIDKEFRRKSIDRSKIYVKKFSEERQAEQLMECYKAVMQ